MRKTEGDISDVSITLGTIKNFQKQRQLSRGTEQFPQGFSRSHAYQYSGI